MSKRLITRGDIWARQRDLAVFVLFWKDYMEMLYRHQCFPQDELLGCIIVPEKN